MTEELSYSNNINKNYLISNYFPKTPNSQNEMKIYFQTLRNLDTFSKMIVLIAI